MLNSCAAGVATVNIDNGTLALGTGGQLGAAVMIDNDAVFSLEDTTAAHTMGAIIGHGITHINAGTSLTAVSINQRTLSIGGSSAATVPEPAAWLLLVTALLIPASLRRWRRK